MVDRAQATEATGQLDRAVRLFEFLARIEQVKYPTPRTVDSYQEVIWFHRLPAHAAVTTSHRVGGSDPEVSNLIVERLQRLAPPAPPEPVHPWLLTQYDDPAVEPALSETLVVEVPGADHFDGAEEVSSTSVVEYLEDHPDVGETFGSWLSAWQVWATDEIAARPVRELYSRLFSIYAAIESNGEDLELVCGTACLSWRPEGHPAVQRHLLTSPVAIDFDDLTGRLTVRPSVGPEPVVVELDMLDPRMVTDVKRIHDIRSDAQAFVAHPMDRDEIGLLGQRLVHCLDAEGAYRDEDDPTPAGETAVTSYAPALVLRKRSRQGLIQIFETIAGQLRESGEIPEGLRPLVDPNHVPDPGLVSEGENGAIVDVDGEVFLPLPVNSTQLKIVHAADRQAQTLVQGPPGTGKTHTAAVLISHLVAQGKRVLVTAQTDRALKEVRDKLPESIRPLAVSVVGASREDMSQLKVAVERIAAEATDHDPVTAAKRIDNYLATLDELRRRRASLYHDLIEAREAEVRRYDIAGYSGTVAAIAQAHDNDRSRFEWIAELIDVDPDTPSPLSDAEIAEWLTLLLDPHLVANEAEARKELLERATLPCADSFADIVRKEKEAKEAYAALAGLEQHPAFLTVAGLLARRQLGERAQGLHNEGTLLAGRGEAWVAPALRDIHHDKAMTWRARQNQIRALLEAGQPDMERLGPLVDVRLPGSVDDSAALIMLARAVRAHVAGGQHIKTDASGTPKLGAFAPKVLKEARPLFESVRVDGVAPTTVPQLDTLLTWVDASRTLDALDRAWPADTVIPAEDTLVERLQWHATELQLLDRVLGYADALERFQQHLVAIGLPPGNWTQPTEITTLSRVVEAVVAKEALTSATEPLRALEARCARATRWEDVGACVQALHESVRSRHPQQYRMMLARHDELDAVRTAVTRRDDLDSRLLEAAPVMHGAVTAEADNPIWAERLPSFVAAWGWAAAGEWILSQQHLDVNALKRALDGTEAEIRRNVEGLTATRAWNHATSSERIDGRARADLQHYAQLVKRLGKGTGKYAGQKRAEIRTAMGECRSSVPVWILPIYRIAEQLRVTPGMFDVVIVDEASQAGLESTFLQYLAPKIVVIGDDKQVSPSAVGVDQQQLLDLADQYLHDDPYRASWSDPQRSLFDHAKMRYGGLITLVEHRRCVPEIIGFSNRVAYEPDGIRLIPIRQYGADRLEPIKPVFLAEGYTKGTTSKVNPVEVEAIVDQIAKCFADPRYDGLTFGVISLLGPSQAKAIETALLERIPSEEWTARQLRCGDSAAFQGSERDVMFLSMVAAPEPDKRLMALTTDMYVQRYNVAASRAKDQMWVFHSVPLAELTNSEDMRFALLDYCYGVVNRANDGPEGSTTAVPEDIRVSPFDSLFEQRVFNRLIDRGYNVIPQYEVEGYRIDLVIMGAGCKLAVECDGDAWHGRDAYEKDIARQRELERCGWRFFRIPEFLFYVDLAGTLASLWEMLDVLDIHPSGWTRPTPPAPMEVPAGGTPSPVRPVEETPSTHPAKTLGEVGFRPSPNLGLLAEPRSRGCLGDEIIRSDDDLEGLLSAALAGLIIKGRAQGSLTTGDVFDALADDMEPSPDELDMIYNHIRVSGIELVDEIAAALERDDTLDYELDGDLGDTIKLFMEPVDHMPAMANDWPGPLPAPVIMNGTTSSNGALAAPYHSFAGRTSPAAIATRTVLVDELLAIVATEGPVVGDRLQQAHVQASGGQRVGRQIAQALNRIITYTVRNGLLIEDDPLGEAGVKPKTYRLPEQNPVNVRQRGPRTLEQVPPAELAVVMREAARKSGWSDEDALFRATLEPYGWVRLGSNVVSHLRRIKRLAQAA